MSEQYELGDIQQSRQQNTQIEQREMANVQSSSHVQHSVIFLDTARPVVLRTAGPLTTFDVFSLIVNKMIGTGIFTAPSVVLALTADRRIAIILWGLAFLYTIIT